MPHEDDNNSSAAAEADMLATPAHFNQELLQALGLGHLNKVVGLSITAGSVDNFPAVHVDMLITRGMQQAVAVLVRRMRFECLQTSRPTTDVAIDAAGGLAGLWEAKTTAHRRPQ